LPYLIKSNSVSIGYVGTYTLETIPTQILSLATQSLISTQPDGKPVPSLASHWTISQDGKDYLVFLKDNLTWHDGTAVDAKDISIAISNVQITALNNKAIEFKLPNPVSSFPQALDKPVFKAKSFYGTGKFRIVNIQQTTNNIVKRIQLVPKDKDLPKVDIRFYPTEEQTIEALKVGEVKSATVSLAENLKNWPNLEVKKITDETELITVFYNNSDKFLSSRDIRQALSYSINKSSFEGESATSPISGSSWAFNQNVKKYDYNIAKAKELLAKANPPHPKIKLSFTPGMETIAEKIQKNWQEAGVDVTLESQKTIPGEFQAFLTVNRLMPDPDQYSLWHSTQKTTNITGYKNVKVDKLLEDARSTQDENNRKELYFDFQKFLVEDAPATFLYHPYKYEITYKNAKTLIDKITN